MESSKQVYHNLLRHAKETGVSGQLKPSNIRIVDTSENQKWSVGKLQQRGVPSERVFWL